MRSDENSFAKKTTRGGELMFKFKKLLSVVTSAAITASMISAFTVTAGALDASISYADGQATATAGGKLIAVSYNVDGSLADIKLYDVEANTPVAVDVSEGDKLMLWSGVDDDTMVPLADTYTVEAPEPTATPTAAPTAEPTPDPTAEPTKEPTVENKVYIDEQFTYDDHTIIAAAGSDVANAPDPVTLGSLVYQAGRRNNGSIGDYAKIEGGVLKINATNFATSGRGILISFAEGPVPAVADIDNSQVLEMSFDVKTSGTFEISGYGNLTTEDITTENVHARIVLDKGANEQYLIVTDTSGNIINSRVAALSASTFTDISFRIGTAWVEIDNLKVETKSKDYGVVSFSVKDSSDEAVSEASVRITDNYSVTTGSDGIATVVLPNGIYSTEASKSGYEHTMGMLDPDKASLTVENDKQTVTFTLSLSSYDKIPDTVTIENGQNFIAAPKNEASSSTAAFTVSVLDQFGIKVEDSSEYTLTWAVYPSGTTTADGIVSISGEGVVSVSKDFNPSGDISEYDVTATVVMNNAGLRGQTVKKTLYVGKNDVIYYEPIDWSVSAGSRVDTKNLASAVALSDISSVTLDLTMQEPEGQRTLFLLTNTDNFVGIQYQKSTGNIVAGTGWSGNKDLNQSGDLDKFTNQQTLISGYTSNTPFEVTFVIDKTTNTVTVSSGSNTVSLPFVATAPATFTGFKTGLYRNYGAMTMAKILVKEPDNNYLSITGDLDFAKADTSTGVVVREYALGQSVLVPNETFSWSVSPESQYVTVENGVLSVYSKAEPGTYTLTAVSDINPNKTASVNIEIGDFQTISQENATITGAHAYAGIGETGTYAITKLVDSYGDDVTDILPAAVWSSSNEAVATIDAATGELTTTGYGNTVITATITNLTAVTTLTVPVTVAKYYITADATGNSTAIDASNLIANDAITGYQVSTSKDGKLVKQETVASVPTSVDTTGADKVEVAPIFTYTNITASTTATAEIPADTYNFYISEASGTHFDPYVNDQMLANNMLQGGSAVNYIAVNDIVVSEGYATLNLRDAASNSKAGKITIVKSPSIVDRTKKVYVLGDSLVCIYANGGDASHNYQTGWGQVLQSYLTDEYEVVDLGNSGVTAEGLAGSAITQVAQSGKSGDVMILESGYNDRSYSTQDKMLAAVTYMYNEATAAGVDVVLTPPNASQHDYKAGVSWGGVMKTAADNTGAKYIDLGTLSYNFLYGTYGSNTDAVKASYNVSDGLHANYNGANKFASIVAGGLIDVGLGDMVNTEYTYTFTDSLGNTITCQAAASN